MPRSCRIRGQPPGLPVIAGHSSSFGGVPLKIIIDNAKCAITRACYYDPEVQRSYGEMAEGYGFVISPCPPRDPQKKGRVESGVKYVKNSFVPLRNFRSLTNANEQLYRWLMETAGNRTHAHHTSETADALCRIGETVF